MSLQYLFTARLWRYPGEAAWHFLTLPEELAAEIREDAAPFRRGFGSLRVAAEILGHGWTTSIFPDRQSGSYLLPVKKAVRTAVGISVTDLVEVRLEVTELTTGPGGSPRGGRALR